MQSNLLTTKLDRTTPKRILFVISQLHDDTIRKLSRGPWTHARALHQRCILYELTAGMPDAGPGICVMITQLMHSIARCVIVSGKILF